ncbi:MAG TPA: ABC transporter permease [Gemmatimonadaceae bacterium]|nr:ABC transporter permease [Gemmatimonadaceae bacterium]
MTHALRSLARQPAFTTVAVVTLAVGISAATVMFSVVRGVLLRPLPVADQGRVVVVHKAMGRDNQLGAFTGVDLDDLRAHPGVFTAVAGNGYDGAWPYVVKIGDRALTISTNVATAEFFNVIGARPAAGRLFVREDGERGGPEVVVLSYGCWRKQFGGDPAVVGTHVTMGGEHMTIVGVAPEGFDFPSGVEAWVNILPDSLGASPKTMAYGIIGRLRPDVTIHQATSAMAALMRRPGDWDPSGTDRVSRPVVLPLDEAIVGEIRPSIVMLAIAVGLVFLIATVNVANLLLIRATSRARELAVRAALGAGRWRIGLGLLSESVVLAALSAALGLLFAVVAIRALVALAPRELPRVGEIRIDGAAFGVALAAAALATVIFGFAPVWWTEGAALTRSLRTGTRAGRDTRGTRFLKQALVSGQVALALIVAGGAALLTRSLVALQRVDMGFAAPEVTMVQISAPETDTSLAGYLSLYERLADRVGGTPVVIGPFSGEGGWTAAYLPEGRAANDAEHPDVNLEVIAANYFKTLGVPLVRGRSFAPGAADEAVVSEALARRFWPGQDPIGKRLRRLLRDGGDPWSTVVGVAGETRYRDLAKTWPTVYVPIARGAAMNIFPGRVAVRTTMRPHALLGLVRAALAEIDPTVSVVEVDPVEHLAAGPLARPRFNSVLLVTFAVVAMLLAAVGLYGVMASIVSQRTHELGLRMALGATTGDVGRLVLRQGMQLAVVGIAAGLAGSLITAGALRGLLYGIGPTDPGPLGAAVAVLLGVVWLACYVPSRRAVRVSPLIALRAES